MDENKLEAKLKAKQAQMEKNKEEIVGLKKKLSDVRKKKLLRERQEQEAKLLRIVRKLRPALESLQQEAANEKAVQELKEDIRKSKNAENRKIQDPFILLQELIKKNDFDASQIREIEQGIEAGLEPEYIYEYASSGKDAAYMKATREFYQSLQKRMKQ